MMSSKKLFKIASKWENFGVLRRKRILLPKNESSDINSTSFVARKGHFVVYTTDQKRFLMPLEYLNKKIFRELLKLSEAEFGLEIDGPITLPCDASFMEYIIMLIERGVAKNIEKALLMSVVSTCSSSLSIFHEEEKNQIVPVCGY